MEYNKSEVEEQLVSFAKMLKDYPAVYDYNRNKNRVLSFEMEMLAARMRQCVPNFTLEDCAWCMSQCRGVLAIWLNEVRYCVRHGYADFVHFHPSELEEQLVLTLIEYMPNCEQLLNEASNQIPGKNTVWQYEKWK